MNSLSDRRSKSNRNQEKQCGSKCDICEYYNRKSDFCKTKELENCSKAMKTEFAQCDEFLVDKKLVMF